MLSNPGDKVIVFDFLGPGSLDRKTTIYWILILTISKTADICGNIEKLLELHFNVLLFSFHGDKILTIVGTSCTKDLRL